MELSDKTYETHLAYCFWHNIIGACQVWSAFSIAFPIGMKTSPIIGFSAILDMCVAGRGGGVDMGKLWIDTRPTG